MNWQKLHSGLYEKGKKHIVELLLHRPKAQQSQFQLSAIVNPTRRLSTRDKVWISIAVFFGIVYIVSMLVSMQVGVREVRADQVASTPTVVYISSTHPGSTLRTSIPKPPSLSRGRLPYILPTPISSTYAPPVSIFNPTPTPCPGVNCNPWGYNFTPGNLIYNPPADFCTYFVCVPNFNKPHHIHSGYVVECVDGMYSEFIGRQGTCALHGGVLRPLYTH